MCIFSCDGGSEGKGKREVGDGEREVCGSTQVLFVTMFFFFFLCSSRFQNSTHYWCFCKDNKKVKFEGGGEERRASLLCASCGTHTYMHIEICLL